MWQKTENGEAVCPPAFERSGDNVILRKGFRLVEATEDMGEHYIYDEWQMTAAQYEVYQVMDTAIREQSDALVELAELISEVI